MDLGLRGNVVMVVGAGGGIGTAVSRAFAQEGCQLALVGRETGHLDELAQELAGQFGVAAATFACDLEDPVQPATCVAQVEAHFDRVDVLAMCAGNPRRGGLDQVDDAYLERTWRVKLMGSVRLTRAVLAGMRQRSHGRIVLIGGLNGRNPSPGGLVGGVTAAALANFARSIAQQAAPDGVTVNVVDPHYTRTRRWDRLIERLQAEHGLGYDQAVARAVEQMPIRRPVEPAEVADLVLFLASRRAGAITGACIPVDGGSARGLY